MSRRSVFLRLRSGSPARSSPIQEQEIEAETDQPIRSALVHCCLQAAEDRPAIFIGRAQLTIEMG